MKLDQDQLSRYYKTMQKKAEEVLKTDHIIHAYMIYRCKECRSIYVLWLEKGLVDPTEDEKTGNHKPVPFGIICPSCGGVAYHDFWNMGRDMHGKGYRSYREYMSQQGRVLYENFFWNDPDSDCGVPILLHYDYPCVKDERELRRVINDIFFNTFSITPNDCEETLKEMFDEIFGKDAVEKIPPFPKIKQKKMNKDDGWKRPRSNKKLYEY